MEALRKEVSVGVSRAENTYAGDKSRGSRREKK
jgi:ribosomal protein S19E (S16A)